VAARLLLAPRHDGNDSDPADSRRYSDCPPPPSEGSILKDLEPRLTLPDPVIVLSHFGETIEANRAFRDLIERLGSPPSLIDLFGLAFVDVLERSRRTGSARASLGVVSSPPPQPQFRVTLVHDTVTRTHTVVLIDVTEETQWQRRLEQRDRDIASLKEIGASLSGPIELDTLAQRLYEQTHRMLGCENFYVALHDRGANLVSFPRYIEEGSWREMTTRTFANGLTEYVLRRAEPLLLNDHVVDQMSVLGIDQIGRPSLCWVGVPMIADGEPVGVMAIQDYHRAGCYGPRVVEILGLIASLAAAAVQTARLIASSRRAYLELAEAQQRLLESERVRGVTETVGALNHEVNNPLAAIVGNAQLLLRADDLGPDVRLKVQTMLDAARRIQRVTGKMETLIEATSVEYPGETKIIDVHRSVALGDVCSMGDGDSCAVGEAAPGP
jgi:hypothetical protein